MPSSKNLEAGSVAPGDPTALQEHRMEYFPRYLLLHAVELFLGQGIFTSVGRSWEFYL